MSNLTNEEIRLVAMYYGQMATVEGRPELLSGHPNTRPIDGYMLYDLEQDHIDSIKLHLRPLESMTEEEREIIDNEYGQGLIRHLTMRLMNGGVYNLNIHETFGLTQYLLSRGFDLFNLKEKGLAVYK
jgi:hypothetical protein